MALTARKVRLRSRNLEPWQGGGMILVGGPPYQGKGIIAAQLVEHLPHALKLEAIDNLRVKDEHWYPEGPVGVPTHKPLRQMLEAAVDIWNRNILGVPPTIIISARSGTIATRKMAYNAARSRGMKFLFVECLSHNIRAMQRLSAQGLSKNEIIARMKRYDQAIKEYVQVNKEERKELPSLRLTGALIDIEDSINKILAAWNVG